MTVTARGMQIEHVRGANFPLSFCSAQIYLQSNRASGTQTKSAPAANVQESETEMSLKSITGWLEGWKRYRAAVRELSHLTDRELADLGIQRSEIDMVARQSLHV